MEVNILRFKTPATALKELTLSLATHNLEEESYTHASGICLFPPKKISFLNSIRIIRMFLSTKKAEYSTNGQSVVEELFLLIMKQMLQKRK